MVAAQEPRAAEPVGDLSGIMQLFARAQGHLRRPAIVLSVGGVSLRLSVAGQRARFPGSINVTSTTMQDSEGRRTWYGRINRAGGFEPGRDAPADIGAGLRRFAADPANVAAEHGRLTGHCCFCNRGLEDERSTSVGYGPICADHYGLPWGARAAAPASVSASVEAVNAAETAAIVAAADANDTTAAEYAEAVAAGRINSQSLTPSEMRARLNAIAN
jgi:hypothetical protein